MVGSLGWGKQAIFYSYMRRYLKKLEKGTTKVTILMSNRKLHNALSIGTKVDDLG